MGHVCVVCVIVYFCEVFVCVVCVIIWGMCVVCVECICICVVCDCVRAEEDLGEVGEYGHIDVRPWGRSLGGADTRDPGGRGRPRWSGGRLVGWWVGW